MLIGCLDSVRTESGSCVDRMDVRFIRVYEGLKVGGIDLVSDERGVYVKNQMS